MQSLQLITWAFRLEIKVEDNHISSFLNFCSSLTYYPEQQEYLLDVMQRLNDMDVIKVDSSRRVPVLNLNTALWHG